MSSPVPAPTGPDPLSPLSAWRAEWDKDAYREINPDFHELKYRSRKRQAVITQDWSGAAVCRDDKKKSIVAVEATWRVPTSSPPKDFIEGVWYTASSWIGIDGDGEKGDMSVDILQAGVDSDVMSYGGTLAWWTGVWWQWVPGNTIYVTNFPVSPGDTIHCVIARAKDSQTNAAISLHNKTNGIAASFPVQAPAGTVLVGNCAEWIVEKVELVTQTRALANHGAIYFDGAIAHTDDGNTLTPQPSNQAKFTKTYAIKGQDKKCVSTGYIRGDKLVCCAYEGPVAPSRVQPNFVNP